MNSVQRFGVAPQAHRQSPQFGMSPWKLTAAALGTAAVLSPSVSAHNAMGGDSVALSARDCGAACEPPPPTTPAPPPAPKGSPKGGPKAPKGAPKAPKAPKGRAKRAGLEEGAPAVTSSASGRPKSWLSWFF